MSIFRTICFGIIFMLLLPLLLKVRRHRILFSVLSIFFFLFNSCRSFPSPFFATCAIQKVEGTHHRRLTWSKWNLYFLGEMCCIFSHFIVIYGCDVNLCSVYYLPACLAGWISKPNLIGSQLFGFISVVRFYAWNMLPASKRLLIWFDRNHTYVYRLCAYYMLNLFTNKRFLLSEIEPISRYMLITECKQEIYLFTTFYRDRTCNAVWTVFFPHLLLPIEMSQRQRWRQRHKKNGWLLFEIQKQVFEFNLSINSVTHGKIMSAQYYEPTTTFPFKIMSGAIASALSYRHRIDKTVFFKISQQYKKGFTLTMSFICAMYIHCGDIRGIISF